MSESERMDPPRVHVELHEMADRAEEIAGVIGDPDQERMLQEAADRLGDAGDINREVLASTWCGADLRSSSVDSTAEQ